jgi:hypothetical protein
MYTPNFNDPRVIRRIKKSIGFTSALTSADKPRQLAKTFIDKHFGCQRNPLSVFLRSQLLVCTDDTYDMNKKRCKEYVTNTTGLLNLLDSLDKKNGNNNTHIIYPSVVDLCDIAVNWGKTQYKTQLDSLNFEYEEKSHRLYNDIQSMRSEARAQLLAEKGLRYDYDIDTAAPTLLYQHSFQTPSATGEVCDVIEYYIDNKEHVRNKLSGESSLPVENIKGILNAHFSGGFLTTYGRSQVFRMCNNDPAVVKFLQQHPFIIGLKADIKKMWEPIKADTKPEYYWTSTNKWRKRPFDPRAKWNIYFKLERMVLDQVIQYCREIQCNSFLEHDGFRTDKKIDTNDLSLYVQAGIGYNLTFKEKIHETV